MAILKIRDKNGVVHEIVALKGEKGDKGDPGSGGDNVLVVTDIAGEVSHTPAEILEAYQQNKAVFLKRDNHLIPLEYAGSDFSYFSDVKVGADGAKTIEYCLQGGGIISNTNQYYPPIDASLTMIGYGADAYTVGKRLGDVETALDDILYIQNSLIGGGN